MDLSQLNLSSSTDRKTEALKASLLPLLWNLPPRKNLESSDAFIDYYMSQRILIEAYNLNIQTHQDLIDLINFIRTQTTIP